MNDDPIDLILRLSRIGILSIMEDDNGTTLKLQPFSQHPELFKHIKRRGNPRSQIADGLLALWSYAENEGYPTT